MSWKLRLPLPWLWGLLLKMLLLPHLHTRLLEAHVGDSLHAGHREAGHCGLRRM